MFLRLAALASRNIRQRKPLRIQPVVKQSIHTNNEKTALELWNNTDKKNKNSYLWKDLKQEQSLAKKANKALSNAGNAAYATLPLCTWMGIQLLCTQGDYVDAIGPILGVPCVIGGFVLDTIKAPIFMAVATEEVVRGGMTKLISLLFEKPPNQQVIDTIFTSFLIRMRETATLLIALNLEKSNFLDKRLKSGDIGELIGLTLLHTAYASRHYKDGILLASEIILKREHCPKEGLIIFDTIMELKDLINQGLKLSDHYDGHLYGEEREMAESRIVCNWIKLIKEGKEITSLTRPDTTEAQRALVNKIIHKISELAQLGLRQLPEPETITRRMSRM